MTARVGDPAAAPVVTLRAVEAADLPLLRAGGPDDDPFGFFGFVAANALDRLFADNGCLSESFGLLVVETAAAEVSGHVGWSVVQHGPHPTARALNIGIHLRPGFRARGIGVAAQDLLARHLFDTTLIERLEAGTDVENVAEQKALTRAGFTREGIARHAQFRNGRWHDLMVYSRLRDDRP